MGGPPGWTSWVDTLGEPTPWMNRPGLTSVIPWVDQGVQDLANALWAFATAAQVLRGAVGEFSAHELIYYPGWRGPREGALCCRRLPPGVGHAAGSQLQFRGLHGL